MFKKISLVIIFLIGLFLIGLIVSGNAHIFRALQLTYMKGNTTANINDGQDFKTRVIQAGEPQQWPLHENYNKQSLSFELSSFLRAKNSAAFLVIHQGELHSEFYFEPYHDRSQTNSFSMSKTLVTMMIGAAIDDGYIESFDDSVTNYIPELLGKADDVTLAHLSAMSSGVDWHEGYYSPFSPTPKLLYGYDAESYSLSRGYLGKPGTEYYYASVSTQILGIALERVLQKAARESSLSAYLSEKFWMPLGMNDDASWHIDAQGMELVYCCVNSNARNFAKFGQLLLQKGIWQGEQLLPEAFIERMSKPDIVHYYGHSLWIDDRETSIFYAMMGHLGQYVIVVPEYDLVVVRLGEFRGEKADEITHFIPKELVFYVDQAIKRISHQP